MNAGLAQPIFPGSSSSTAGPPIACSNNSGFSRKVSETFLAINYIFVMILFRTENISSHSYEET
jgi:hypothetical protein